MGRVDRVTHVKEHQGEKGGGVIHVRDGGILRKSELCPEVCPEKEREEREGVQAGIPLSEVSCNNDG